MPHVSSAIQSVMSRLKPFLYELHRIEILQILESVLPEKYLDFTEASTTFERVERVQ